MLAGSFEMIMDQHDGKLWPMGSLINQPVCRRMINWGVSTLLGLVQPAISPGNEETHSRTFILNILNKELPVAGIGVGLLQIKDACLTEGHVVTILCSMNCQQIHALHRRRLPLNHHDDHCPLKPHSCWFILVHYLGRWTGIALWRVGTTNQLIRSGHRPWRPSLLCCHNILEFCSVDLSPQADVRGWCNKWPSNAQPPVIHFTDQTRLSPLANHNQFLTIVIVACCLGWLHSKVPHYGDIVVPQHSMMAAQITWQKPWRRSRIWIRMWASWGVLKFSSLVQRGLQANPQLPLWKWCTNVLEWVSPHAGLPSMCMLDLPRFNNNWAESSSSIWGPCNSAP